MMVTVQGPVKAYPLFIHSFNVNVMFLMACPLSCSDHALVSEEKFGNKRPLVRMSSSDLDRS
jgi:hypothetical protein